MNTKRLLDLKISRISVDIDVTHRWDAIDLFTSLLKIKEYFGNNFYVRLSASRRGFHIVIPKEVNYIENILWRGFLYDDANRIRYCLSRMAMRLLRGKDPLSFDVDLLFVSKRYGSNKPFKRVTPIKIEELFGEKLDHWLKKSKEEPHEVIKEMNEYIDTFAEKLGITEVYIVYGRIDENDVGLIQKVKRAFMNSPWKLYFITDPYHGDKILAKVDVGNVEEAEKVKKFMKELGIKEVWHIKRRF